MCAKEVGVGVRCSTLLPNVRLVNTRQFASAQQIDQLAALLPADYTRRSSVAINSFSVSP
jgi:hypothetical protein